MPGCPSSASGDPKPSAAGGPSAAGSPTRPHSPSPASGDPAAGDPNPSTAAAPGAAGTPSRPSPSAGPVDVPDPARSPGRSRPQQPSARNNVSDPAPTPDARRDVGGEHRSHAVSWPVARGLAGEVGERLVAASCGVAEALGQALGGVVVALTDLPAFDTSAMDGWAVAGPGPWRLPHGEEHAGILAGCSDVLPLRDGEAVRIATGARVPPGATAVLRSEHGTVRPQGELYASRHLTQGQDIRPRGQECRRGDELLPAGTLVTPAVLGLVSAAGYDRLRVVPRPRVEVLVLGDELLREGLPHDGRIRDALGPLLGPWLQALGAEPVGVRRLGDDAAALRVALEASDADVVLTTGGTAGGPVDHVHPTLHRLGAELLVDGVAVRPGHPMLLARLAPGRYLVGLPGNPLAAVAGLLTLAEPLLRTLSGRPAAERWGARLSEAAAGHATDTRLVPVAYEGGGRVRPLRFHGPAMLRGLASADALAVVPPGGVDRGGRAELLGLPWQTGPWQTGLAGGAR
ncbi:molybdopterin-binding protein [Streptomyces cinnamoneus]|uniref:molybdopterin molybdotransferase MoeA n=1 Tax=Streptomyces cinnamoneus TaxID=53446 RepID=UPI0033CB80D6